MVVMMASNSFDFASRVEISTDLSTLAPEQSASQ